MRTFLKRSFVNYLFIFMFVFAGLTAVTTAADGVAIKLTDEDSGFLLLDQDQNGLTVRMDIGTIKFLPVTTAEGNFILPQIDGFTRHFNEGEPTIPIASGLLDIPFGCKLKVKVIDSTSQDIKLADYGLTDPFFPVQPPMSKSSDPRCVPFVYKRNAYEGTSKYTLPLAATEIIGTMRGYRVGRLSVSPVEYYPAQKTITVHTSVTVKITYKNPNWTKTEEMKAKYKSAYYKAMGKRFINYVPTRATESDLVQYPVKYLIIADRMFESQLQPFIQWKTRKGFKVVVGYTDTIGSTTTAIKSYIQTQYNNGTTQDPAPSFVLFVGDAQQIPTWSGSAGSHVTDLRYCEFTGDDIPEIYYGRFSAQNTTQLQPQIDKTLEYEQYTMPDPSYLNEVTLISGVDTSNAATYGNGQINYGTNLYFNASHGIYPNVWLYPASDASSAPAAIKQTVSDGVGFLNYTAHCSHTGMGDPSFTTSDIPNLTNAHKYLLGIGNCCLSNTFGTDYSTPCFGEAWLQAANKGGIGWIGGTNSTYWDEDYWFGVGYGPVDGDGPTYAQTGLGAYDGVFHDHSEPVSDHYITNGAIIFAGNMAVEESGSSRTRYYWEIYHLMGDPSVMTYMGVPSNNSVSHPSSVTPSATTITVSAAAGSYVGISKNNVLHGAGYIGTSGSATIALTAFGTTGTADIVVTCQNKIPYISTLTITSGSEPPTAAFTASPTTGMVPLVVSFTDQSTGATSWAWDFGDTGTSTQQNPSHTYNTAGTYTVTLTATNSYGNDTETKTGYITVSVPAAPVANFSANVTTIAAGESVTFTDQSTNNPTSWAWSFPGGTPSSSSLQNPTVVYNTAGTYSVSLTATNGTGSDGETKTDYITVTEVVPDYCASQGNNYSYEWISSVVIGPLSNTSGAAGYTDFTNITEDLTAGNTYNVTLTPDFSSSTYTEYWKIYIDYNRDGDFEDTGEEVFSATGTSSVSGSFTVPAGLNVSNTRMRVSMKWNAWQTPCETFSYGEVEDYTVNIISGGTPTTYTLTTNTSGQGSISLNPTGGVYNSGTTVTVTATPASGWQFSGWSGSLSGTTNPTTIYMNSNKTVTATFTEVSSTDTIGYTTAYSSNSVSGNRRAQPFTMPEDGTITSISMYHTGGSGSMILAVYSGTSSAPQTRIAVTPTTTVSSSTGWQTINLSTPVYVESGSTIWLAWVYEDNPGIRYTTGTPGRYDSGATWSGGMPTTFGSGSTTSYLYSIYATYNVGSQ